MLQATERGQINDGKIENFLGDFGGACLVLYLWKEGTKVFRRQSWKGRHEWKFGIKLFIDIVPKLRLEI